MLTWKLRIAVLWMSVAVVNAAIMILLLFEPGAIRDLMDGEWLEADAQSAGVQIAVAINLLAPMAMAFLTLALGDVAGRRTNLVVGSFSAVNVVLSVFGVLGGSFGAGVTFVALVGAVVALAIVWHAWRWPLPAEVTSPRREKELTRSGA